MNNGYEPDDEYEDYFEYYSEYDEYSYYYSSEDFERWFYGKMEKDELLLLEVEQLMEHQFSIE
jgi:hypothetical protein